MNVYLQNFGCKVNAVETDSIAALLHENGWNILHAPEGADAVVINSCTVTASGDKRMLQAVRKLRAVCPDAVIVLTGCYVQAFPQRAEELTEADILVGTKERSCIPELLAEFFHSRRTCSAVQDFTGTESFEQLPIGNDKGHTRAFLKIQDGCNRFCSYCIIPYARGRCRSLSLTDVECRAAELAAKGFREIVLCGINLACYGEKEHVTIADAADVCRKAGFPRVRLGSLEPDGLTDAVLEQLAGNPAFCPQFHISLQSGCDRTLQAMHRHYTCAEYARLVEQIRRLFPRAALTTDIMTGFPQETEADFAETLAFAEQMQFAKIHIFRYSRRPGTLADRMEGQVPEYLKKERADRLSLLEQRMQREFLESRIGMTVPVLFEREKQPQFHGGHAPDYSMVLIPALPDAPSCRNQLLPVRITGIRGDCLLGELLCE